MKTLVTENIHPNGIAILEQIGEVVMASATDSATLIKEGQGCEAALVRIAKMTPEVLNGIPTLKVVAKHGVGTDNIDRETCTKNGIYMVNAPHANTNAVAEHALGLMFAAAKKFVPMDKITRDGGFKQRTAHTTVELSGRTLGLIGFGNIAKCLAKKAQALGMNIIAFDPFVKESDLGQMQASMDDVLKQADFISMHTPLLADTKGMIGAAQFAMMKNSVIFVDASRGGVVDEAALVEALKSGQIAAAGTDVFAAEPPADDCPLFALDNIVLSPHNAALTEEALINMAVDAAKGIAEVAKGETITYLVNKEVL